MPRRAGRRQRYRLVSPPSSRRDFPVYLTGLGSVQAFNTVALKSRIDGQIMQVNFQEGQDVSRGQLLIQIDPRPYEVALQTAQANLQRDEAQLNNAKVQYERMKALYAGGVIAKQDLDTQEASFGQYEGTIAADKAAIESAKLNLVYTRITSPINGRIGLRQVDIGNYVQASSTTPMVIITQLHPIAIDFTLAGRPTPGSAAADEVRARWQWMSTAATTRPSSPPASC